MPFPRQNKSSVKISTAPNNLPHAVKEVGKWNIPIAAKTCLGESTAAEVNNILKDNINGFSASHGKYLINLKLEYNTDHCCSHYVEEVEDSFSYLPVSHTFTCYNNQLEGSTINSKIMWKIKLNSKTNNINVFMSVKNDLQIKFLNDRYVMIPINILIAMKGSLTSRSNSNSPHDNENLYWYIINLSTGEYFGCFNMQKNRFGSILNIDSEIKKNIYRAGQIYVDGPDVFTTVSDYLHTPNEERTHANIDSDGYIKPFLHKVLMMPLNSFLLASQIGKCDELLINNISSELKHKIGLHSFNNYNESYIRNPSRKKILRLRKFQQSKLNGNPFFKMSIGYGVRTQLVPPTFHGEIPMFHYNS